MASLITVRRAVSEDLAEMVALSEQKRASYEPHQPIFWRTASDAAVRQRLFFGEQLRKKNVIPLVAERDGRTGLCGFLVAVVVPAPPVYSPGGLTCAIDDFVVSSQASWEEVGRELLSCAASQARAEGAVQIVVVCGNHDAPKRAFLGAWPGLSIASVWFVGGIPTGSEKTI